MRRYGGLPAIVPRVDGSVCRRSVEVRGRKGVRSRGPGIAAGGHRAGGMMEIIRVGGGKVRARAQRRRGNSFCLRAVRNITGSIVSDAIV